MELSGKNLHFNSKISHLSGGLIFSSSVISQVTVRVKSVARRVSLEPAPKVIHLESQKCSPMKKVSGFQFRIGLNS